MGGEGTEEKNGKEEYLHVLGEMQCTVGST